MESLPTSIIPMGRVVLPNPVVPPNQKAVITVVMSGGAQTPVSATGLAIKGELWLSVRVGHVILVTMAAHVGTEKLYSDNGTKI
jgi:hypothetical protein